MKANQRCAKWVLAVSMTTSLLVFGSQAAIASTAFTDTSASDFNAGSQTDGAITNTYGGEATLSTGSSDFPGTALPSNWESYSFGAGSTATVASGVLTLDGKRVGANQYFGPGQILTFTGTFTGDAYQHGGFGTDYSSTYPSAMFTTSSGGALYAGVDGTNISLGTTYLNSSRNYSIAWNFDNVVFSIGGTVVATIATSENSNMRPLFADSYVSGGKLKVSKVRVASTPNVTPNFLSFPALWNGGNWATGGSKTTSAGVMTLDGSWAAPTRSFQPGSTLTFDAYFTADQWQQGGFATTWASGTNALAFTTMTDGHLHIVANDVSNDLGTTYLGGWHTYSISWQGVHQVYSVDGTVVGTLTPSVDEAANLRPSFSDLHVGYNSFKVKAPTVTSYAPVSQTLGTLPSRWSTDVVRSGGTTATSGNTLSVDGVVAGSTVWARPGSVLEFTGTISAEAWQQAGWGTTFNAGDDAVGFQVAGDGVTFNAVGGTTATPISSSYLGSPHNYKISRNGEDTTYYVDNTLVATINYIDNLTLRPLMGDLTTSSTPISVSSMTVSPQTGTFMSRVINSGSTATVWGAVNWSPNLPTGSSVALSVRSGNTATPNGTWSSWTPIASSGNSAGLSGQYVQYMLTFSASSGELAPYVGDVSLVAGP